MLSEIFSALGWISDIGYWLLLYLILDQIGATKDMMLIFYVLLGIAVLFKIINLVISISSRYST